MWNSLALKSEVKMLGTKTIWTATTIKIDEGVPAAKFAIPSDIKFENIGTSDPLEMMNKEKEKGNNSADTAKKASTPAEEAPIKNIKDLKGFLKKLKPQ